MKKIFFAFLLTASVNSFSQPCEEREVKLQQAMVSFSSALMYNTYGVIGSIADAYVKNAYNAEMVDQLMNAQKKKQQKKEAYDEQRKNNWSALSKLMGIKE